MNTPAEHHRETSKEAASVTTSADLGGGLRVQISADVDRFSRIITATVNGHEFIKGNMMTMHSRAVFEQWALDYPTPREDGLTSFDGTPLNTWHIDKRKTEIFEAIRDALLMVNAPKKEEPVSSSSESVDNCEPRLARVSAA